jgi:DNA mismatch repair ATPase MutS
MAADTPMMQRRQLKQQYPDAILLFRWAISMMFFEDACGGADPRDCSTARDKSQPHPVPMCGVPTMRWTVISTVCSNAA